MKNTVRDIQKDSMRQRVVAVATQLFMSRGIRAVTMNDVAHSLKMSKRTIYELFPDKEMLLIGCYQHWISIRNTHLRELMTHTDDVLEIILGNLKYFIEMMTRVSPNFLNIAEKYPRLIEFSNKLRAEQEDVAVQFLEKGIEQGLFIPDIDCRVFLHTATSMGRFIAHNERLRTIDSMSVFRTTFFIYLRGITTEKGRQRIDDFAKNMFKEETILQS